MTLDEIKARLEAGYTHEVCPDSRWCSDFPGYVRRVFIRQKYLVSIEYELYNMDEGGAYFQARFSSLEDAVRCIEQYIEKKHEDWLDETFKDHSRKVVGAGDVSLAHEKLADAIRNKSIQLPSTGEFNLIDSYWTQFEQKQ